MKKFNKKFLNRLTFIVNFITTLMFSFIICYVIGKPQLTPFLVIGSFIIGYAMKGQLLAFNLITGTPITFNGEEATEGIIEEAFAFPLLTDLLTVETGIVAKKQLAFLGKLSKITKRDAGCGNGITSKNIDMTEKFWDPQPLKIWLTQCSDDLEQTFFTWGLGVGIKRKDLTGTDFIRFVMELLTNAAAEDAFRNSWFADKDIQDFASGGVLGSASDIQYYDGLDGIWKQIYAGVAASKIINVGITENSGVSKVAQLNLASDRAYKTFKLLAESCDKRLKQNTNARILCTDNLFDNWLTWKETQTGIQSSFDRQGKRITKDFFRGIPIINVDAWDRYIQGDFDNGTTYDSPTRAIMTVKENLRVGVDTSSVDDFEVFYVPQDEINHMKGNYKMDTKLLWEYNIITAY